MHLLPTLVLPCACLLVAACVSVCVRVLKVHNGLVSTASTKIIRVTTRVCVFVVRIPISHSILFHLARACCCFSFAGAARTAQEKGFPLKVAFAAASCLLAVAMPR